MKTNRDRHHRERPALRPVRRHRVLATRVLLWGLVGLAALGGLAGWMRPSPRRTSPVLAATPPDVATVAERAVALWLRRVVNAEVDSASNRPATVATDTPMSCWAVAVRRDAADAWQVTVATDIPGSVAGTRAPTTWFVTVGVVRGPSGQLMSTGAPAVVPPPETGQTPHETGLWRTAMADDPLAQTVSGFASALLTGNGDATRYAAPGVHLASITPPPFTAVTVTRVAAQRRAGGEVEVHAAMTATTPAQRAVPLVYDLTLLLRDSRWEIAAYNSATSGAPTVDDRPSDAPSTTAPAGATTTTALAGD